MEFKYGKDTINIKIPSENVIGVLEGRRLTSLKDPEKMILDTFGHPISSESFYNTFKSGDKVAIVVSDRTRNSGSKLTVPVLLDELNSIGINDSDIFVLFACGTHRTHTANEHAKLVGEETIRRVKVFDHDSKSKSDNKYLGTTTRGTKVELDKRAVEADKVILTGAITYHYFAGYGGGRKSVLPGISAFETIQANHKLLIKDGVIDRRCATGRLEGNPIHEDMLEAANMLEPDFLINTVMSDEGKIAAIFSGDPVEAHLLGCEFLDENFKVNIEKKADIVIAASGGGSKDINFIQSHKAMEHASYALRDGGVMVLLAESSEGFPGEEYARYINLGSSKAILKELSRNFTIPGHTVYAAFEKAEKFKIIWVSKMDDRLVSKMGIIPKQDVVSALDQAFNLTEGGQNTYVIPQAYNTFPYLQDDGRGM